MHKFLREKKRKWIRHVATLYNIIIMFLIDSTKPEVKKLSKKIRLPLKGAIVPSFENSHFAGHDLINVVNVLGRYHVSARKEIYPNRRHYTVKTL